MSVVTSFILGSRRPVGISDEHGRRLVPPRSPRPRSARAGRGGPRARSRAAAVRRSTRCCSGAGSGPPGAPRGCSTRCARSTRSCALAAAAWRCAAARRSRCCPMVAREVGADAVHCSEETTGFARARDDRVQQALGDVPLVRHPGVYIADLSRVLTKDGRPYTVFSPFLRTWTRQERRPVVRAPGAIVLPSGAQVGRMPSLATLGFDDAPDLLDRPPASEAEAQSAAKRWVRSEVRGYGTSRNTLADDTSRLSVHLRFGTLSPLLARGARPRRRRRRGQRVPLRARLARLLRRGPAAPPRGGPDRVPGALPGHASVGRRPGRARGLEGGRDRLSRRGRRHAPAARHGLDAQPGADDRRLVPREGPPSRLAARRGALHGAPARRRRRLQQRRLAVGRLDGHGSRTVFPAALQSDPAAGALRSATVATSGAGSRSSPTSPTPSSESRGRCQRTNRTRPGASSAGTTPLRSWITPRNGGSRWSVTAPREASVHSPSMKRSWPARLPPRDRAAQRRPRPDSGGRARPRDGAPAGRRLRRRTDRARPRRAGLHRLHGSRR